MVPVLHENGHVSDTIKSFSLNAWEVFEKAPLPDTNEEAWRRTDIKGLRMGSFRIPTASDIQVLQKPPQEILEPLIGDRHGGQIVLSPERSQIWLQPELADKGLIFTDLQTARKDTPEILEKVLGKVVKPDEGKFAAMAAALSSQGILVYIPRGLHVDQPLHSLLWGPGSSMAYFSHILIYVDRGASLTYMHEFASPTESEGQTLHSGIVEIIVEENANLRFVELQSWGEHVWNFTHERAIVSKDAHLDWIFGAIGSHLTKNFSEMDLTGQGAVGKMSGFYFTEGDQHLDHDTQQNHHAPNTTSDLLFKGALKDHSRSVWQGMIYVAPGAQKTDGYQANRNLVYAALEDEIAYTVGVGVGTDLGQVGQGTTILVIGSDLDQEAPVLYLRIAGASTKRGAHVINAGGRRTKLDAQAQTSLRYHYGTVAHLVLGLLASAVEQGLVDHAFVDAHTAGFADIEKALVDYALDNVADITGIPADEIDAAAKAFAEAANGIILFGLEAGNDPALRAAIEALALITGHAGKPNNGVIAVLPHANSRGAADMGVLPHQLPGYVPVDGDVGLSTQEMLGESPIKALLIAGADPAANSEAYRAALRQLDFLVVQDLFLTETAKLANVVLPAQGVAERDGSFTNLERRVQTFEAGVPAPGQARADWLILTALAGQMGAEWLYGSADGVMAEITEAMPLYAQMGFENLTAPVSLARKTAHYIYEGMSFTTDVREGIQWITLAEGAAKIGLRFIAPVKPESGDGITLVASRFLYDDGRLLAEADVVKAHITPPQILLSRFDAKKLDLTNGDTVTVSQNGASVDVPVQVTRMLSEGVAVLPRNLAGRPAEKLVGPGGMYTTVHVEKRSQE